ncbi:MAG: HEAT repeat domain-containing protein, partial [Planctomycetaceae bacterium]|nr:HEAT repeat domain-containing protein [Planctomycetaceae bacterium]
ASLPGAPAPLPFRAVKSTNREDRLNFCLAAPQPLSSWSRLIWEPIAKELTSEPFILAALDAERPTRERIRAIEILTEKYQGVDSDMVQRLADDPDPMVRARAVWSVGRSHPEAPNLRNVRPFLEDDNPLVVRTALEALLGAQPEVLSELLEPLARQLAHPDRFLRQTALGLLPKVVDEDLRHLAELAFPQGWQASIPIAIEFARRQDGFTKYPVEIALSLLKSASSPTLRMEAVRLLQLGLGDLNSNEPDREPVFDGYSAGHDLTDHQQEIREILQVLDEIYPSGATSLDRELERVMAMLAPDHGELFQQVVSRFTVDAHPVDDFHRLIVISRFRNSIAQEQRQLIAEAILHLERKLIARELRQDTSWNDRFVELYDRLVEQDSELPAILAMHPDFGDPGHVRLTKHIPSNLFDQVISRFAQRIRSDNDYEWSADVVYLLGESLKEDEKDLVRGQFEDYALRDSVIMSLANHPLEQDRRFFSAGLEAAPFEVLESCVNALGLLPPSEEATENVAMALALRRLGFEGKEAIARDQLAELLRRNLKEQHGYTLGRAGDPQRAAVNTWVASVQQRFPEEFARQSGGTAETEDSLRALLTTVPWSEGAAERGAAIFKQRGCVLCHGQRGSLGPDLLGATGRFSRDDLFVAIALPDRDVSPRYQTEQIATVDGHVRTGLIVYEAVDGVVLRDANNRTYRIEADEIEIRKTIPKSIMPSGLLKDLQPRDLADLYAFLKGLSSRKEPATQTAGRPSDE